MILTIPALFIIGTLVVLWAVLISRLLDRLDREYLFTISAARPALLAARLLVWLVALGSGIAVWFGFSWSGPSVVTLALLFATEAVALDICVYRIQFIEIPRATTPAPSTTLSPQPWRH